MQPEQVLLSVIIPTYNRVDILEECLQSFSKQDYVPCRFEVIIVDNNSSDQTHALVAGYLSTHNNFRYFLEERQGVSFARNRGFSESRGEYLVYMDDDVIVPPGYLSKVSQITHTYHPDILGGPIYPYYRSPKPAWFRDEFEVRKYAQSSGFSADCNVSGGNYIIRKEVLAAQGLFNPVLGMIRKTVRLGEEKEILVKYRQNTPVADQKVYYCLEIPVKHLVPATKMTLRYQLKRAFSNGRLVIKMALTYKSAVRIIKLLLEPGWMLIQLLRGGKVGDKNPRSWLYLVTYPAQYCGEVVELAVFLLRKLVQGKSF